MTDILEIDVFRPHEGSVFNLRNGVADTIELQLIEVRNMKIEDGNRRSEFRQEPFRLTFRGGAPDIYLPQQIYNLTHDILGSIDVFLVPIGPDSEGMCYEAIYN